MRKIWTKMNKEFGMKEGWMCAVYLYNMCKQTQIFPIRCSRGLKELVNRLRKEFVTQDESEEFTLMVERNEFHPNEEQIKCCVVFLEELSTYSDSDIENLFIEYANQRINEDRARIRNNKIDSLGI